MAEFDLVIRNGEVFDGAGGGPVAADIGVKSGRIAAIGKALAAGREEIDAAGRIVTPGFVDVHTHYDGQATWDSHLEPSTRHGVTTAITGNCGVGFAPCRPKDRDALIRLMEGVEDIPGVALHEGLAWDWESFPDYLDALAARPRDCDVAAMIPHGGVRVFVMGERAIAREPAEAEDIAQMRQIVSAAIDAGAIGFGTSRTIAHRTADGEYTPMYGALRNELAGIAEGLKRRGVFQMVSDFVKEDDEFAILEDAARAGAAAASFSLLQADPAPEKWRSLLARTEAAAAKGLPIRAQVISRPVGVLMGLEASMHPFSSTAAWREIKHLPLAEKVSRMRDPEFRARLLSDEKSGRHQLLTYFKDAWSKFFPLGDPPDYAPGPERSIAAIARGQGRAPEDVAYDLLLEDDGHAFIYLPLFNYSHGDLGAVAQMLSHPLTVPGLGDGGAHVGAICDGSATTYLMMHWARDRRELPLGRAVEMLTRRAADLVGLHDRGSIAVGKKADLNVIDLDRLAIAPPRMAYDLPAGGKRFTQGARGYAATVLSGVVVSRDDAPTGALPGQVVRGRQAA
ncbi:MAG: amidohydrolase family protein [Alphaproteobacteria bacterium]|nr:amidohydrolase family protein [Alphaproteobacteria bacterium]